LPAIEVDRTADISARAAAQLEAAVRDGGRLALSMFGKPIKQWTKGPSSSPVSEADIAVDALLRERLAGGSNGFADPENRIGFAYVMNQMELSVLPSEKSLRLVDAIYQ